MTLRSSREIEDLVSPTSVLSKLSLSEERDEQVTPRLSDGLWSSICARLDHPLTDLLPSDPLQDDRSREVREAAFSYVTPSAPPAPKLRALSDEVVSLIGFDEVSKENAQEISDQDPHPRSSTALTALLSGGALLGEARPYATCYGGHQFGHWAGQLGDGRALTLATLSGPSLIDALAPPTSADLQSRYTLLSASRCLGVADSKKPTWELQLKGAGHTPYSRTADGKAVLRSSVREFLCSEAMYALGVPTTRALSLVTTGEKVWRDPLYNGNPLMEQGAVVCRVAPSFLRFGHFELPASRGELNLLKSWFNYAELVCLGRHSDSELSSDLPDQADRCIELFDWVATRTAELVVEWMRVGFVHGVMNTDNLSMLGLTIDYGPYGWIEPYDLNWTPNTTDLPLRRYRFGAQLDIAHWNLSRLAYALSPLCEGRETGLIEVLERWVTMANQRYIDMMCAKIGVSLVQPNSTRDRSIKDDKRHQELVKGLMGSLQGAEVDMTLFFRELSSMPLDLSTEHMMSYFSPCFYDDDIEGARSRTSLEAWLRGYAQYSSERVSLMAEAQGGVKAVGAVTHQREALMKRVNPKYILRNYLAHEAIEAADEGDDQPMIRLLNLLKTPYDEHPGAEGEFSRKRPEWARNRPGCSMLSCSS